MHSTSIPIHRRPSFGIRVLAAAVINFVGLWIAGLISLVDYDDRFWVLLVASLVLAFVNILIKPLTMILSIPFIIVTLGFFILVVNAFMLWITDLIVPNFDLIGFWRTVGAAIVLWFANMILSGWTRDFTRPTDRT